MFRFVLSCTTLLAAFSVLYFLHIQLTAKDTPFYRKLVRESADLRAHSTLEKSPVRQTRKRVSKDVWTVKEGKRVHGRIESSRSEMTLSQKKEKMEAVEVLHEIEGWIESDGSIRHVVAESGICYFPTCRAIANHLVADLEESKAYFLETHFQKGELAFFGSFHIEHPSGRMFGEKGILKVDGPSKHLHLEEGVLIEALNAPFSLSSMCLDSVLPSNLTPNAFFSEEIQFSGGVEIQTASDIRAIGESARVHKGILRLFPEQASTCTLYRSNNRMDAKEIRYTQASNELLCLFPHGRIEENRTLFDADTGHIQFLQKGLYPETLQLEGNVRIASYLQGKESFAMADSAIFNVKEKKVILQSSPANRVLFRQDGLDVSSSTVHIQDAVQGFGDVRFFFYPEETSLLETIFSKYL